jgi:hypothetical protein
MVYRRRLYALVVGNAAYPDGHDLANPVNDATDISKKLTDFGFDVTTVTDATVVEMNAALKTFQQTANDGDVALFFFAGHGMQIEGDNYLLAVDTDLSDEVEAKHSSLALDKVIERLEKSGVATKLVVLDACRNNPWARKWTRSAAKRGLAPVFAPKGTMVAFATSPGETAADGKGRNGTYTAALLQHLDTADVPIESMLKRVRNTVAADTSGKQTTWEHTSLSGEFYFNLGIGNIVTEYAADALSDARFVIDETKPSHRIIKALKSHNWYTQNPPIKALTVEQAEKMLPNNLFVLGRNIYQAACGGAAGPVDFIANFATRTKGLAKEKRKAMLDGMLFEIFFDPNGQIRDEIKGNMFSEVFELQENKEFAESFEFIANVLDAGGGKFYALPGKNLPVAATVKATKTDDEEYTVDGVFVDGVDVFHVDGDEISSRPIYRTYTLDELARRLSEEMVVPLHKLDVKIVPPEAKKNELRYQYGWTVRAR